MTSSLVDSWVNAKAFPCPSNFDSGFLDGMDSTYNHGNIGSDLCKTLGQIFVQTYLSYPQLFLFAYDRQIPGSEGGNKQNWDALRDRLDIPSEVNQPGDRDYPFRNSEGQGFYLRYGGGDVHSLMVALMPHSDETSDITLLSRFRQTLDVPANLGKTWLILGYVNSRSDSAHFQAAHAAYQGFFPSQVLPPLQPSKVLNCSVFEVWNFPQDWKESDGETEVILICICPSKSALKRVADFYSEWLGLFSDRHQIWSAYRTSQLIQKALAEDGIFRTESILPDFPEILPSSGAIALEEFSSLQSQWHQNLVTLAKHRTGLAGLEVQRQGLISCLKDYEKRLQRIQGKLQDEIATSDLKFLVEFRDDIAPQYHAEIEQQWRGFKMGLQVREQFVQGMEALLNSAQGKNRDRRLENAIASAAIGIGTTTASAISMTQAIALILEPASSAQFTGTPRFFYYGILCLGSIFLGILLGGVCWMGLNYWRSPD